MELCSKTTGVGHNILIVSQMLKIKSRMSVTDPTEQLHGPRLLYEELLTLQG